MSTRQPKPDQSGYASLIKDIEDGIIKIPKFQRDFVWSKEGTAKLLDSILKGYPIGTLILWETSERLSESRNVGDIELPNTPDGRKVKYVLDGQQRITSLFAAYRGAKLREKKKVHDYKDIFIDLSHDLDSGEQIIVHDVPEGIYARLHDVLSPEFDFQRILKEFPDHIETLMNYQKLFHTYQFSTVLLTQEDVDAAIEVFTRINTGGKELTLFEIMAAKTYDEKQNFDMDRLWSEATQAFATRKYEGLQGSLMLNLLTFMISEQKNCRRKFVLQLDKQRIIDNWGDAVKAISWAIDYFRLAFKIPASNILPYHTLLVPFAYFSHQNGGKRPTPDQAKYLSEFFWRASLASRFSGSSESALSQDIRQRIDPILKGERPSYQGYQLRLNSPEDIIETEFSTGNAYCLATICLLASCHPQDFADGMGVDLENAHLVRANSKNYHHFFPKAYLARNSQTNANSLANITLISDVQNKRRIKDRAPSDYISESLSWNPEAQAHLSSHLIEAKGFGIENDDYDLFLKKRAALIFDRFDALINLRTDIPEAEDAAAIVAELENDQVELKSTLCINLRTGEKDKAMERAIVRTVNAFLNTKGGRLFIGVDDNGKALGLDSDLAAVKGKSLDGFRLRLADLLTNSLGALAAGAFDISFPEVQGQTICQVSVSETSKVWVAKFDGKEFICRRIDASSKELSVSEAKDFSAERAPR